MRDDKQDQVMDKLPTMDGHLSKMQREQLYKVAAEFNVGSLQFMTL